MLLKLDYELEISKRVVVDEGPAIESTIGASYLFVLASESAIYLKLIEILFTDTLKT